MQPHRSRKGPCGPTGPFSLPFTPTFPVPLHIAYMIMQNGSSLHYNIEHAHTLLAELSFLMKPQSVLDSSGVVQVPSDRAGVTTAMFLAKQKHVIRGPGCRLGTYCRDGVLQSLRAFKWGFWIRLAQHAQTTPLCCCAVYTGAHSNRFRTNPSMALKIISISGPLGLKPLTLSQEMAVHVVPVSRIRCSDFACTSGGVLAGAGSLRA